jgi:hypothetical protein
MSGNPQRVGYGRYDTAATPWCSATIGDCDLDSRPAPPANVTSMDMPRHWIVLQVLIVIFVLAGAVIAITKLA